MALSSDESSTVNVCARSSDKSVPDSTSKIPNVMNAHVELVDFLSEDEENLSTEIISEIGGPMVKFNPLLPESRRITALKFNLVLKPLATDLCYFGVGTNCKSPPVIKRNT